MKTLDISETIAACDLEIIDSRVKKAGRALDKNYNISSNTGLNSEYFYRIVPHDALYRN